MAELKTRMNDASVTDFIESVENPRRREDAYKLLHVFTTTTGMQPKMWGNSMIGYGDHRNATENVGE